MDSSWLPESRRPHAQDVSFALLDSGCRPTGCCENTSCDKVVARSDIPAQVSSCAEELPTGCYYYAKAVANVTGALCHHDTLWSSASGVCFDMIGLGGWQIPIYSLWQIHNAYTEGCRHIRFSMHKNVTNESKAALRSCSWSSEHEILPATEMLMERKRKPLAMFTPRTISTPDAPIDTTVRVHSGDSACVFRLDNYFEFPKLQIPLRLIVTTAPAVLHYIKDAMKQQNLVMAPQDTNQLTTLPPPSSTNTLLEQLYSEMVAGRPRISDAPETPSHAPGLSAEPPPHLTESHPSNYAAPSNHSAPGHPDSINVTSREGLWGNVTHEQMVAIYTDYVRSHITGPSDHTTGDLKQSGYLSAVAGAAVTTASQSRPGRSLAPAFRPPFSGRRIPLLLGHHNRAAHHISQANDPTEQAFLFIFLILYTVLK